MWTRHKAWVFLALTTVTNAAIAQVPPNTTEPPSVTVVETVGSPYEADTHSGVRRAFGGRPARFAAWNCWDEATLNACVRAYGTRVVRVDVHEQHIGCSPIRDRSGTVTGRRMQVRAFVEVEVYGSDGVLIVRSEPRMVGPGEDLATVVEEAIRTLEPAR